MTETEIANLAISYIGGRPADNISTATSPQALAVAKWFDAARDEALKSHPWNFAAKRYRAVTSWSSVTGAVDNGSGLIRITSSGHGLSTGDRVQMKDVGGVGNATGTWYVTVNSSSVFDLQDSVFSGTYTSGGTFVKIPLFGWEYMFTLPADMLAVRSVNGYEGNENDSTDYGIEGSVIMLNDTTLELIYTFKEETVTNWPQDFINVFALLLASYIAQDLTGPAGRAAELRQQYETLVRQVKARDAQQGKGRRLTPGYDSQAIAARRRGFFTTSL